VARRSSSRARGSPGGSTVAVARVEIVVARAGKPVARLVPVDLSWTRPFGGLSFEVHDDFDEPLPDAELAAWE
jgi:antitoxin (DNA-binding transcriptional repressor) of toxin-antitoxin stability system